MIRVGLVGFGRMGLTHYAILNTHPEVKIVAVCDQSGAMLSMVEKYLRIPTYEDYRQMMETGRIDCVVISTPVDSHGEIIRSAVERGIHVFVEKPFTLSVDEGQEIVAVLEDRRLVNQVGYPLRFNEVFLEVKRLLEAGVLGDVVNIASQTCVGQVLRDSNSGWRAKKETGGGCLYEFASHCIDLVVFLFDLPDAINGSVMQSIYSSHVEDLVSCGFVYNSGCTGTLFANWSDETYRKPTITIQILGKKGKIIADMHAFKIYLKEADHANGFESKWTTRYITDLTKPARFYLRGNEFTNQLDHFIDSILQGTPSNRSSFKEGLKTDVFAEGIRREASAPGSTKQGQPARPIHVRKKGAQSSLWGKLFKR
jgi:predicted dehydrogenase